MMKQKICPIMAKGWLANKHAADGKRTFMSKYLPKCLEEECALWTPATEFTAGHCKVGENK